MKSVPFWLWVVVAIVFYAASEYVSKLWGEHGRTRDAAFVVLGYGVTTICWLGLMAHRNQLFVISVAWQIVGALIAAFVGAGMFGERLAWWQWLGAVLGGASTVLLVIERGK